MKQKVWTQQEDIMLHLFHNTDQPIFGGSPWGKNVSKLSPYTGDLYGMELSDLDSEIDEGFEEMADWVILLDEDQDPMHWSPTTSRIRERWWQRGTIP